MVENTKTAQYTIKLSKRPKMEQASEHLKTEWRKSSGWWNTNITNTRKMSDSRVSTETWDGLTRWAWWSFNWRDHININTELTKASSPDSVHSSWLALAGSYHTQTAEVIIDDDDYSSIKVSVLSSWGLGCATLTGAHRERKIMKLFSLVIQDLWTYLLNINTFD